MVVFSLEAAQQVLLPLVLWTAGLVIYGVFVYKFYRFLARRKVLDLDLHRFNNAEHPGLRAFIASVFWLVEFAVAFPIMVFFWFFVLTMLLAFLSPHPAIEVALIAMALVAAVRVTAHVSEDLSRDLAKMLPFALLGVFLIDSSGFAFYDDLISLAELSALAADLLYYLGFIVVLELVLRFFGVFRPARDA